MTRLMAPPLPAASQPSNTASTGTCSSYIRKCSARRRSCSAAMRFSYSFGASARVEVDAGERRHVSSPDETKKAGPRGACPRPGRRCARARGPPPRAGARASRVAASAMCVRLTAAGACCRRSSAACIRSTSVAEDLHPRPARVGRLDHRPGRGGRIGEGEHVLDRFQPSVVAAVPAPVLLLDLPALGGVVLHLAQAPPLLLLRDVEPELHQHLAVVGEPALELVDLRRRRSPSPAASPTSRPDRRARARTTNGRTGPCGRPRAAATW